MDKIDSLGIKVPNAVLVCGLTESKEDEEILEFLKGFGSFNRTVKIDDPTTEFHTNLIIEYNYGTAVQDLESLLPYTHSLKSNPEITYHVRALASVYTQKVGSDVTQTYLDKLKGIAKLSGKDYEEVLKEVMSQIEDSIEAAEPSKHATSPQHSRETDQAAEPSQHVSPSQLLADAPPLTESDSARVSQRTTPSSSNPKTNMALSPSELNPPEVQKIVVEHIVRSEDRPSHSHSTLRLRGFSGKVPRPHSEVDYDTWRSHVDLMMKDLSVSDLEKTRKILESLLVPASDVVRHLGPEAPPTAYLHLLDSAFATVEDGEELFMRFMNTFQDSGEKPSTYLQRLQVALGKSVRRGGVSAQDTDKHLLRQFCRGCWDNVLLADLHLEHKKQSPPPFAELLMLLRTEEDKQEAKVMRMKQHLGTTRQKAVSHMQTVCNCSEPQAESDASSIHELKKQVADLKSQLTSLMKKKKTTPSKRETVEMTETQKPDHATTETNLPSQRGATPKPKPWYCFRCGEDGHIVSTCESDANPALVAAKRKELRQRQQLWEAQNTSTSLLN